MNGKTTILLSGLVAVLMVTCAIPFMASEDSDALIGNTTGMSLNTDRAVLYDSNGISSIQLSITQTIGNDNPNSATWYFNDLDDGDDFVQLSTTTGSSTVVSVTSLGQDVTQASIEVVASINVVDSNNQPVIDPDTQQQVKHTASAVIVVRDSPSTQATEFHFFIQIDSDAYDDIVVGGLVEDAPYTEVLPYDYDIDDLYDGIWIDVYQSQTNIALADFNAGTALSWYISTHVSDGWYGELGSYGWIEQLFNLKTYEGDEYWDGDDYIGIYYYYWAQYHLTNDGWVFNNNTLGFTTSVEEMYIGLIFWASPPTMDVPEDYPTYPF